MKILLYELKKNGFHIGRAGIVRLFPKSTMGKVRAYIEGMMSI
jgi:hypothetical protein